MRLLNLSLILVMHWLIVVKSHPLGLTNDDIENTIFGQNLQHKRSKRNVNAFINTVPEVENKKEELAQKSPIQGEENEELIAELKREFPDARVNITFTSKKKRTKRSDSVESFVKDIAKSALTLFADRHPSIYKKVFPDIKYARAKLDESSAASQEVKGETTTTTTATTDATAITTTAEPIAAIIRESIELKLFTNKPITEQEREELREMRKYYPYTYSRLFGAKKDVSKAASSKEKDDSSVSVSYDDYSSAEDTTVSPSENEYETTTVATTTATESPTTTTTTTTEGSPSTTTALTTTLEPPTSKRGKAMSLSEYFRSYPSAFDFIFRGDKRDPALSDSIYIDEGKKRKLIDLARVYEFYKKWSTKSKETETTTIATTTTTTQNPSQEDYDESTILSKLRSDISDIKELAASLTSSEIHKSLDPLSPIENAVLQEIQKVLLPSTTFTPFAETTTSPTPSPSPVEKENLSPIKDFFDDEEDPYFKEFLMKSINSLF